MFAELHARVAPFAAVADESAALPDEVWDAIVESGYLRLFHPREHGGTAADAATLGAAMEALARASAGAFWAASISTILCGKLLHELCRPIHHTRWLRPIVDGAAIGCFAATEDGPGTDPGAYQAIVVGEPGALRLRGHKSRISNALTADVAVVLARREGGGLCYVVVDLHRPGVRRRELPRMGLRAMSWGRLEFDDLEVADEDVIVDANIERTLRTVEWGQLLQAWCAIGIAAAAIDACRDHARGRIVLGRPLAEMPVIHGRLADMEAELHGARLLAAHATCLKGQAVESREAVILAKIHATDAALRIAEAAMRTLGGWGYAQGLVERLVRDALGNIPAGLPNDRLRELVGCALVGEDPWRSPALDEAAAFGLCLDDPVPALRHP